MKAPVPEILRDLPIRIVSSSTVKFPSCGQRLGGTRFLHLRFTWWVGLFWWFIGIPLLGYTPPQHMKGGIITELIIYNHQPIILNTAHPIDISEVRTVDTVSCAYVWSCLEYIKTRKQGGLLSLWHLYVNVFYQHSHIHSACSYLSVELPSGNIAMENGHL